MTCLPPNSLETPRASTVTAEALSCSVTVTDCHESEEHSRWLSMWWGTSMKSLIGVPVTCGLHRLNVWSAIDPKSITDGLSYCRQPPFVPWIPHGSVCEGAVNDYGAREFLCPASLPHGNQAPRPTKVWSVACWRRRPIAAASTHSCPMGW
jgi:hypothetical protein